MPELAVAEVPPGEPPAEGDAPLPVEADAVVEWLAEVVAAALVPLPGVAPEPEVRGELDEPPPHAAATITINEKTMGTRKCARTGSIG